MAEAINPYAPSAAVLKGGDARPTDGLFREGNVLVLPHDHALPDRCVKCNAAVNEPRKERKVYWHHPGYYTLLLINVILYAVVALIVRKTAKVSPALCESHKRKRTIGLLIGIGASTLLLIAAVVAGGNERGDLTLLCVLAALACMVAGIFISRIVYASRINDHFVYLKGCGEEFLAGYPEFHRGTRNW